MLKKAKFGDADYEQGASTGFGAGSYPNSSFIM